MSAKDILGHIGRTPLVELRRIAPRPRVRIFAKLEAQNPTGSVKDRIALGLVRAAERQGKLKPGATIIEASSGNTGIALAFVAKQRGYKARVVLPRTAAPSIQDILRVLGVEVTWAEPRAGMKGAIDLAQETAQREGLHLLGQFTDPANVEVHYRTTGAEIVRVLSHVDAFVAGIGTGGTIMGVGRRLREANAGVRLYGVEPAVGERLQGLRSLSEGFVPPLLDLDFLDGRFLVDGATAFECARRLAETEGILAGASSGAVLHAALRVAERMERGTIVIMFADGGLKYLPARPWDAAGRRESALDEVNWW